MQASLQASRALRIGGSHRRTRGVVCVRQCSSLTLNVQRARRIQRTQRGALDQLRPVARPSHAHRLDLYRYGERVGTTSMQKGQETAGQQVL